tara:strand:- start:292 stop:609 length:318 start_codon:yes stop_codon:yes gene_type:complete
MIIYILLIIFGSMALLYPNGKIEKMTDSYDVPDLIQAWGIYAITMGLMLLYPRHKIIILIICFLASIVWHIIVARKKGWTNHHRQAVYLNIGAVLSHLFLFMKIK